MTTMHAWSRVRGLQPVSLCDWPQNVACVLFLGGCNCKCPHCHNADLAWRPATLPIIPREEVEAYIRARRLWLDGMVISGGEPMLDTSILELLDDIGALGIPVKVDSNGMRPDVLKAVLAKECVKMVSVDIKGPFEKYGELTGGSVEPKDAEHHFEKIFAMAHESPEAFHFRTTLVPELTQDDIDAVRVLLPSGLLLSTQKYVEPASHQ